MSSLHPAYLYIGPHTTIKKACKDFIKSVLCTKGGCSTCTHCTGVEHEQHYLVRWIVPEHSYTLAHLEVIFKTIVFALDEQQHFFFVLDQAELLSPVCANSLLKSLEEPPQGYHFMLLAQRRDGILPTISSRCVLQSYDSSINENEYTLLPFFTSAQPALTEFSKELERAKIAEWDMLDFIDHLYQHWATILSESIKKGNEPTSTQARKVLELLDTARTYPPMPGSGRLFLRTLFLRYLSLLA
jgi:hypothetical protein